jgi:hypothetical protein
MLVNNRYYLEWYSHLLDPDVSDTTLIKTNGRELFPTKPAEVMIDVIRCVQGIGQVHGSPIDRALTFPGYRPPQCIHPVTHERFMRCPQEYIAPNRLVQILISIAGVSRGMSRHISLLEQIPANTMANEQDWPMGSSFQFPITLQLGDNDGDVCFAGAQSLKDTGAIN